MILLKKIFSGKRFRFTSYDKSKGPIHSSIEALDRSVSVQVSSIEFCMDVHVLYNCIGHGVHFHARF